MEITKKLCSSTKDMCDYCKFYIDNQEFIQIFEGRGKIKDAERCKKEALDNIKYIKKHLIVCGKYGMTVDIMEKYLQDKEKAEVIRKVYGENKEEIEREISEYRKEKGKKPEWATEERARQELKELRTEMRFNISTNLEHKILQREEHEKYQREFEADEIIKQVVTMAVSDEYKQIKKEIEGVMFKYILIHAEEELPWEKVEAYLDYVNESYIMYDNIEGQLGECALIYYPELLDTI